MRISAMTARTVTFKGNPVKLVGKIPEVGAAAPDFACVGAGLEIVTLAKTPAKARLFSVVPSLDTGVCQMQTKKFNEQVNALGDKVVCYTVSLDMPFAQKRFCDAEGITHLANLSDMHNGSFGKAYGVLVEGLPIPLLTRSIFIVDAAGKITYVEIVPEIASHPDYEKTLAALKTAAG
jgi:thioredoxin-dependent peroxiredoxin